MKLAYQLKVQSEIYRNKCIADRHYIYCHLCVPVRVTVFRSAQAIPIVLRNFTPSINSVYTLPVVHIHGASIARLRPYARNSVHLEGRRH